jgi:hypothetical protein
MRAIMRRAAARRASSVSQPRTLSVAASDGIAVADGGAVSAVLKLAPAVARSAATLDLTTTQRAVRDMTAEERAMYSLMAKGAWGGLSLGGVAGAAAAVAAGDAWLTPTGGGIGLLVGPFVVVLLHDHPVVRRTQIGAVRLARLARRLIR